MTSDIEAREIGGLRMAGHIDIYDPNGNLNCEMDGEVVAGVRYIGFRIDLHGCRVLILERDPTLAAHLAADSRPEAPRLAVLGGGGLQKNSKGMAGVSRGTSSGSSWDMKPAGNSELPNSFSLSLLASVSFRFVRSSLTMAFGKSDVRSRATTPARVGSLNVSGIQ